MPSTKWKLRTQREKWYAGETISVAIGQGAVMVTPIQLASAIGGLANGGVWYKPHLVKLAAAPEPVRRADFRPENIETVVAGMYGVVNEGGTGLVGASCRPRNLRQDRNRAACFAGSGEIRQGGGGSGQGERLVRRVRAARAS